MVLDGAINVEYPICHSLDGQTSYMHGVIVWFRLNGYPVLII